jgi:hypothetical protein
MAEEFARSAKFEYRANSNLVLQADTRGKRSSEPSGEVASLRLHMGAPADPRLPRGLRLA